MEDSCVPQATKRLLSIDELSHFIGISKGTLYNWVSQRKIPFVKCNGLLRFDVEKYKRNRKEKATGSTVNRELACLRIVFNKAMEWGKVHDNPVRKVKYFPENKRRLRYLTKEEIKALYNASADHLRPILIVALNTGMRKSEILNLKWEDIDFRQKMIYILNTKNNEKREIPMNQVVFDTLPKIRKHPDSSYIFYNRDGKPYGDIKKSFFFCAKTSRNKKL